MKELHFHHISYLFSFPNFFFSILSDNSISNIDSDAFVGLQDLKRLILYNCGLTVVPGEALKQTLSLSTL